jgi:hypothetical protein
MRRSRAPHTPDRARSQGYEKDQIACRSAARWGVGGVEDNNKEDPMRYMSLWRPGKNMNMDFNAMNKLVEEETRSGRLVSTGGWSPDAPCTVVKADGGKVTVTDGPYTEAKEVIGGYAILEVKSKEELLAATRNFLRIAGDGTCEIRELQGPPPK